MRWYRLPGSLLAVAALCFGLSGCDSTTVTFASPTPNATVSGDVTLAVNITNQPGTTTQGVQYKLGTQLLGPEITSAPFQQVWHTPDTANGTYTLTAAVRAHTTGANSDTTTTATVSNITVHNTVVAGSTLVLGDSLEEQGFDSDANGTMEPGPGAPANLVITAYRGWDTTTPQILQSVADQAALLKPEVAVVALNNNKASPFDGGWTSQDNADLATFLSKFRPDTKVAVVLPAYLPVPLTPDTEPLVAQWRIGIDAARQAIPGVVAQRPNTSIYDPLPEMQANSGLVSIQDGIHLRPVNDAPTLDGQIHPVEPAAAELRRTILWSARAAALTT